MKKRFLSAPLALRVALDPLPGTALAEYSGRIRLKSTNEVRWIDRVELPDYAITLYETLEEAADGGGYRDYLIDGEYFDLGGSFCR